MNSNISPHIFRAYDIRGLYNKDISPLTFYHIGTSAGTYIKQDLGGKNLTVGCDIRRSSPPLVHSFIAGVTSTGVDVLFTGTTSFGQTLFTGWKNNQDLISFVTASHLPPEWNGIKFYYGDGVGLPEEELIKIRDYTLKNSQSLSNWQNIGGVKKVESNDIYNQFFKQRCSFKNKLKVAIDCGGASMTLSAPEVFDKVGLEVIPVFCEPDPLFSQRPSDPKPQNLEVLINKVRENNCDFGVAFDGDGDRSVIVDNTGKILSADQTGIVIGKHGNLNKGTVIVNVECSKAVKEQLEPLGYKIKQIPVGHTFLTLEAKKEHSPLGIESSGHLIITNYFLFDDAIVVPLKIAEILDNSNLSLSEIIKEIPIYPTRKEEISCPDEIKFDVVDKLKNKLSAEYSDINVMDGIRINLENGWVLIRCSNTSPLIRLTTEADSEKIVDEITNAFKKKTEEVIKHI
jgi:phosphomannomutase